MQKILLGLVSLLCAGQIWAQTYEQNALTFSRYNMQGGTARMIGVAGNFSAVGPDAGNITLNPASAGMMRSSFLNVSLGIDYNSQNIDYLSNPFKDNKAGINFSNLAAGLHFGKKRKPVTLALTYNRKNSYRQTRSFEGVNNQNSITNLYQEEANRYTSLGQDGIQAIDNNNFPIHVSPETFSAWAGWLVNWDSTTNDYQSIINAPINQAFNQEVRGFTSEFDFALGGALLNKKLYVGGSVGIPYLRYETTTNYDETDINNNNPLFFSLNERRYFQTSGAGFNLKAGLIVNPVKWLRISGAIHTPSLLSLTENWTHRAQTSVSDSLTTNNTCIPCNEYSGNFEYRLRTPWKANAGFAFVVKKIGFASLQYDVVDYGSMRYTFSDNKFLENEVNAQIKAKYGYSHRLGAGLEAKLKLFRFRVGYAYQTSPFKDGVAVDDFDLTTQTYSGGLGIALKKWAIDLAYARTQFKQYSEFYQLSTQASPGAGEKVVLNTAVLTVSYKLRNR